MGSKCLLTYVVLVLSVAFPVHSSEVVHVASVEKVAPEDKKYVILKVKFRTDENFQVTWLDRNGRQLIELQTPSDEQDGNTKCSRTKINADDGPARVTIGTSLNWVGLTIDTSFEAVTQSDVSMPEVGFVGVPNGEIKYPRNSRRGENNFKIVHPKLGYIDEWSPFTSMPFFAEVYMKDEWSGDVIKLGMADSGAFYPIGTRDRDEQTSETSVEFTDFVESGVLSVIYYSKSLGNLVQASEVGRSISFYPDTKEGPFSSLVKIAKPYSQITETVNCYGSKQCQVSCVVVSGQEKASVSVYDSQNGGGVELASVSQLGNEPIIRLGFEPIPQGESIKTKFRCQANDSSDSVKDKNDVDVSFRIFPDINKGKSKVMALPKGGYKAVCYVRVFPPQKYTLTYKFTDSSLNYQVEKVHISNPHWSITVIQGELEADKAQGELTGVQCNVMNVKGSGMSTRYFIPYNGA